MRLLAVGFLAAALSAGRSRAEEEGGTPGDGAEGPAAPTATAVPEAPPAGLDLEEYTAQLAATAETCLAGGDPAKAVAYVRYIRTALGRTRFAAERAKDLDAIEARAEDAIAAQVLAQAVELEAKNPAKAWERLVRLRTELAGTRLRAEKRAEIEALETRVRTALWPGKRAFRGAAVLPADGVLRLTYAFERLEELGDFDAGDEKAPPKVEGGRLVPGRAGSATRHRLGVPAAATLTAEVAARGTGKLAVLFDGGGGAGGEAQPGLSLEVEASAGAVRLAIRGGGSKENRAEAEDPRPAGAGGSAPFTVRIVRQGGQLTAATIRPDGTAGVAIGSPIPGGAAPGAGGAEVRLGLAFPIGKVEVESLVVEGPLPAAPALADPKAAAAAAPPLPRRVWIPLAKSDLSAWTEVGKWRFVEGGVLHPETEPARLLSKELKGRKLDRYTFTVDVRVGVDAGKRPAQEVFAVGFPVGDVGAAWVFSGRDMHLAGAEAETRHLGTLPPNQWQSLVVRVTPEKVEGFVGEGRMFSLPNAKVMEGRRLGSVDTLALAVFPSRVNVDFRNPRLRLD